jgi:hypothetical protein
MGIKLVPDLGVNMSQQNPCASEAYGFGHIMVLFCPELISRESFCKALPESLLTVSF